MLNENIFDIAKQRISIIDVVKHVLGEPAKVMGVESFWYSQSTNEKSASFAANDEKGIITDFSRNPLGSNLDIFSFLVSLNNHPDSAKKGFISNKEINNYEALEWLNKEFSLNLNLTSSKITPIPPPIKTPNSTSVKQYSLETTDLVADNISAMFDTQEFKEKPDDSAMRSIKYRIGAKLKTDSYNLDEIKNSIISGKTCIPAGIKSKKDWCDGESFYQIFMVDIDNVISEGRTRTKLTTDDDRHVSVNETVEYCESINLKPTFIYYTFSHTEMQHKFRLVYVLEKPTQNQSDVEGIYKFFKETFREFNIDNSATDLARVFYGGTSIAYESNIFYRIKVSEEVSDTPMQTGTAEMQELAKICNNYFIYTNYKVWNGKLWYVVNDNKATPISNFVVFVRNKITFINGVDNITKYELECHILDHPSLQLPPLIVDLESYSKMNFIDGSIWERHAIFSTGRTNIDKQKEVMKIISRQTMHEYIVYANTGFEKIDGKLCYLHHGGVIGDAENVSVDLSDEGLERYCFTDKEFDVKQALQRSLSFLDVAENKITIPILATVFLSPLTSMLGENDIHADFIVFIQGKSGTRKSSLSAVALSHFGNFNRDTFPTTFRDTFNSIEKTAFILKDTLNIIDDFNPETNGNRKLVTMESIYGTYGDRTGRKRLNKDIGTKKPYIARGLCIVTGEMIPEVAQSRIARSLIVTVKQDSINLTKLAELQENKEELAYCMKQFIKWIIDNETKVVEDAKSKFKELRTNQKLEVHGRTTEMANLLLIGFTLFTQFLQDFQVIDITYKNKLDTEASTVLNALVESQTQYVADLKPTDIFYDTLEELLNINKIFVYNLKNPPRPVETLSSQHVGYYDEDKKLYYLYPDAVYNAVVNHYSNSSSKKFPVNAKTLWRYMAEEGLLERGKSYEGQNRYTVPKIINGKKGQFLPLKERTKLFDGDVEVINGHAPQMTPTSQVTPTQNFYGARTNFGRTEMF